MGEPVEGPRWDPRFGPTVLVVDDDPVLRRATRALLEDEGYKVDIARDGVSALRHLRRHAAPSLILLDLVMQHMGGDALLEAIDASDDFSHVPVVLMTGSDPGTADQSRPILRKPFGIDELLHPVTTYSPRLWDDDEPTTSQDAFLANKEERR